MKHWHILFLGCMPLTLQSCYRLERLKDIGDVPPMSRTQNPTAYTDHVPVQIPISAAPEPYKAQPNSLWRAGARTFFKDQRASRVGDILTVVVKIDDRADFRSTTTMNRNNATNVGVNNLAGFENKIKDIFPTGFDPSKLINFKGNLMNNRGTGQMTRQERVQTNIGVMVTQVLPNGSLVISGRQESRFGFEVRTLLLTGIIRPEDITAANTISWDKIAEARFSYAGHGDMSDIQQPSTLQQVLNHLF